MQMRNIFFLMGGWTQKVAQSYKYSIKKQPDSYRYWSFLYYYAEESL